MRSTSLFPILCLFLFAVLSTAWEFNGFKAAHGHLLARQDNSETTAAETGASPTAEETATETSSPTATDGGSSDSTESPTTTGKHTGEHATQTGNSTTTKSISVDPRLPAGGISMINPPPLSTTYYKIGDNVTFAWNYTSLSITPSAVNVVASCSLNSATYTISSNMSVAQTGEVVWDTGAYQANATVRLLTATYTLIVYDDSKDPDDVAGAGELGTQSRYYFGMYSPQPYEPRQDFVCATCNSAFSAMELNAIKFAVGMAAITIASFTWFAGGFGLFST